MKAQTPVDEYVDPADPVPPTRRSRRRWPVLAVVVGALVLWGGAAVAGHDTSPAPTAPATSPSANAVPAPAATPVPSTPRSTPHPTTGASARPPAARTSAPTARRARSTALALLATIPVKGRAPQTGYDRDQFGQAWLDTDRNGCDTRNDILRRDLSQVTFRLGTRGCLVESGVLADPYTATRIHYVRGNDTVDIDHVVALSNAWQTGAFGWDIRKRAALANDPMNLLAVDMSANRQKGDGDLATWLPANKGYRCAYAVRQVSVKAKYHLWVTPAEHDAMTRVLTGCPDLRPLTGGAPVVAPVDVNPPSRSAPSAASGPGPVEYQNCDAVRAAGAAPIHRGDPGYAAHLDRDGDGTGCE